MGAGVRGATNRPSRRPGRARLLGWLLLVALPWSWYLFRNGGGPVQVISLVIPPVAAACLFLFVIVAAVRRNLLALLPAVSVAAFGVVAVFQPKMGEASPAPVNPLRIASANVFGHNDDPKGAVAALRSQRADVVVVVESPRDLTRLLESRDHQHTSWVVSDELALGSDFPARMLALPQPLDPVRVMRVLVDRPGAPFVVYVLHDLNPLSDQSWTRQLNFDRSLRDAALREHLPGVLIGDFNLSDRTEGYRLLNSAFRDAMRAGHGAGDTYRDGIWRLFFLRVDHVFTSTSWCAEDPKTFDVPGSDHQGIAVTTGPCP